MRPVSSSILFTLLLLPSLQAEATPLTSSDREAMLDKLQKLQDAAEARVASRFAVAVGAFREALTSDQAAVDLYLKCIEKVEFEDEYRKSQDFREWRRKESEKLKSMSFKRALRHQLRWLILSLQVASNTSAKITFEKEAASLVDDLFDDLKMMDDQQNTLRQSVTGTVFAQAYKLNNLSVKDRPMSPIDLEEIYDRVILPPYRTPSRIATLRSMWQKRIQQEADAQEIWSQRRRKDDEENKRIGTAIEAMRTPEMDRYIAETYPDLLWQMEVDVYKAGGEREAAVQMFQHLEKYVAHPKAEQWGEQLRGLLTALPAEQVEGDFEVPEDSAPPATDS